jgi:hypothetical protein
MVAKFFLNHADGADSDGKRETIKIINNSNSKKEI